MSDAYLYCSPLIINNLGGEMIYILRSRLRSQKISKEKSQKVIGDIIEFIFMKQYQDKMYEKKKIDKHQEVRKFFEKLVHCSIMKLNQTSMSKLIELMLMTLKLELVRTRFPEEIYQITVNHFDGIKKILNEMNMNEELIKQVNEEEERFKSFYSKFSAYDYVIFKSTLLRFLQGKNVKVSVFIQDSLQGPDSIIYLPMNEISPPLTIKPGTIDYFVNLISTTNSSFCPLPLSESYKKNTENSRFPNIITELGKNMYDSIKLNIIGKRNRRSESNNPNRLENDEKGREDIVRYTEVTRLTGPSDTNGKKTVKKIIKKEYHQLAGEIPEIKRKKYDGDEEEDFFFNDGIKDFNDFKAFIDGEKKSEGDEDKDSINLSFFGVDVGNSIFSEDDKVIILDKDDKNIKKKIDGIFEKTSGDDDGDDELLHIMDGFNKDQ